MYVTSDWHEIFPMLNEEIYSEIIFFKDLRDKVINQNNIPLILAWLIRVFKISYICVDEHTSAHKIINKWRKSIWGSHLKIAINPLFSSFKDEQRCPAVKE